MHTKIVQFVGRVGRVSSRFAYLFAFGLALALMPAVHAQSTTPSALISSDTSGNITFSPNFLTIELITVVTASIAAAAGLYFAWTGVRWIYRIVRGTK
jgi:hypothetical protein